MIGHGPADDPTAERIEYDGQVEEPGPRRDVGDVRDPQPVGLIGRKAAVDQVRGRPGLLVTPRRHRPAAAMARPDETRPSHQPGDALAAVGLALVAQLRLHAWRAVGLARVQVDRADTSEQHLVRLCPRREGTAGPSVVPAFETPSTRAMTAIGKCAWFALMNRKIPTAELRSRAQTRLSRERGCRAPASTDGSRAAAEGVHRARSPTGQPPRREASPPGGLPVGRPRPPSCGWLGPTARTHGRGRSDRVRRGATRPSGGGTPPGTGDGFSAWQTHLTRKRSRCPPIRGNPPARCAGLSAARCRSRPQPHDRSSG